MPQQAPQASAANGGAVARRIRPRGVSPDGWRWSVPRMEFLEALGSGQTDSVIAKRLGVHQSHVLRMKRALTLEEIIKAHARSVRILGRRSTITPAAAAVTALEPIDALALLPWTLSGTKLLMEACEKAMGLRTKRPRLRGHGLEVKAWLDGATRVYKGVWTCVQVQEKLAQWVGMEQYRQGIMAALDRLDGRTFTAAEFKREFLDEMQRRIALLRASRDPQTLELAGGGDAERG